MEGVMGEGRGDGEEDMVEGVMVEGTGNGEEDMWKE